MFVRYLLAVAIALLPGLTFAQASWNLTNTSNEKLSFDTFDPARGTWKPQTIFPHQPVSYTMSGNAAKFRIATQNRGHVEYNVAAGGRYTVGWDKTKGVWDLKSVGAPPVANAAPAAPVAGLPAYQVRNASNQTVSFETLDPARGTWKQQTAYPNETKSMTFNSGLPNGKIRIATQGRGYVEYDVHSGWKYNLMWDQAKGVWDFKTAQRGV